MSFKLIDNHLAPAEGEVVVRTYHCTNLSPIFALIGLKIDGYLTVTNKRVVYFAEGSSGYGIKGNSKVYDEVPIADVAYMSLGKGTRFSFLRLILGLILGLITAGVIASTLSGVMSLSGVTGSGDNPYLHRLGIFLQLSAASLLAIYSLSVAREKIARFILAFTSLMLLLSAPVLALTHRVILPQPNPVYQSAVAFLSIPLGCYALWCLYWFIRREYLRMSITSKGGRNAPISIFGVSWWGKRNVTAYAARNMAPGVDADAMFKELGAMVTDIQTLGDHGIQKWLRIETEPASEETNPNQAAVEFFSATTRYAMAAVVLIGLFVGGESIWYASGAKRMMALDMRNAITSAKQVVARDKNINVWVPKLLASAEQEAAAGETAFERNKYADAMAHWKVAINVYTNLSNQAAAMNNAASIQSKYKTYEKLAYMWETASERLKTAYLTKALGDLMAQYPNPNEPWQNVKQNTANALAYGEQEKWASSGTAWEQAGAILPQAVQLMRADIWVKLAENEIKKGNAASATNCAENALVELPRYATALQRKELAANMLKYAQWLYWNDEAGTIAEFSKRLDQSGDADWTAIKGMVENAKSLANQNEWDKCNEAWKSALGKMPGLLFAMRLEKMESANRRGNWENVTRVAGLILQDHPDHLRAIELKRKADAIQSAHAAEFAYQQRLVRAIDREIATDHIKIGDMADFIAQMDRYGKEEWLQVKDAVSKAEAFKLNEQGNECSTEWVRASSQFPKAVQRMHAEIWMEQAELEAKNDKWAKALIYAGNALREMPIHLRAMQLRDQADAIVEKSANK